MCAAPQQEIFSEQISAVSFSRPICPPPFSPSLGSHRSRSSTPPPRDWALGEAAPLPSPLVPGSSEGSALSPCAAWSVRAFAPALPPRNHDGPIHLRHQCGHPDPLRGRGGEESAGHRGAHPAAQCRLHCRQGHLHRRAESGHRQPVSSGALLLQESEPPSPLHWAPAPPFCLIITCITSFSCLSFHHTHPHTHKPLHCFGELPRVPQCDFTRQTNPVEAKSSISFFAPHLHWYISESVRVTCQCGHPF